MEIGIIGLGDMGILYAKEFSKKGYVVNGCDLPKRKGELERELEKTNIKLLDDGIAVSRRSDLIFYCVEAENIGNVVKMYGPSTKKGAIVAGQTSVKTPEIEAFEKYLPSDINIVTCHSMHGPSISTKGQTLAVMNHRSSKEGYERALETFEALDSRIIEIKDYREHDKITADTQALTHIAFESMGTAWKNSGFYPWENPSYIEGIDNVKILMTLRIYGGKSHIYSGLAIFNPFAKDHIEQYSSSESELFSMMIQEKEKEFKKRLRQAGDFVFNKNEKRISLEDKIMKKFNLGKKEDKKPNSHLSLLSMVDAWHKLKINPYQNLVCQTPVYRLRLGIAESLFTNEELLEESLETAIHDKDIRKDDLEFHTAVREWSKIVSHKNNKGYKIQFEETQKFFEERISEGMQKSSELIKKLT